MTEAGSDPSVKAPPRCDATTDPSQMLGSLDARINWNANSLHTKRHYGMFHCFADDRIEAEYRRWSHSTIDYGVAAAAMIVLSVQLIANGAARVDLVIIVPGVFSLLCAFVQLLACCAIKITTIEQDIARFQRHLAIQRVHWLLSVLAIFGFRYLFYTCFVGQPRFWTQHEVCTRYISPGTQLVLFGTAALIRDTRWCVAYLFFGLCIHFLSFASDTPPSANDFGFRIGDMILVSIIACVGNYMRNRVVRRHFATVVLLVVAHKEAAAQRADRGEMLRVALPEQLLVRLASSPSAALWDTSKKAIVAITEIADFGRVAISQTLRVTLHQLHHLFTMFDDATLQFGVDRATVYGDAYVVTSGLIEGTAPSLLQVCRFVKWQQQLRTMRDSQLTLDLHSVIVCGEASGGVAEEGSLQYAVHGEAVTKAMRLLPQVPAHWCWIDKDSAACLPNDAEFWLGPAVSDGECVPLGFRSHFCDDHASSTGYVLHLSRHVEDRVGEIHKRLGLASLPAPPAHTVGRLRHLAGVLEDPVKEQAFQEAAGADIVEMAPYAFSVAGFLAGSILVIVLAERLSDPAQWEASGPGAATIPDQMNIATFSLLAFVVMVGVWMGIAVLVSQWCSQKPSPTNTVAPTNGNQHNNEASFVSVGPNDENAVRATQSGIIEMTDLQHGAHEATAEPSDAHAPPRASAKASSPNPLRTANQKAASYALRPSPLLELDAIPGMNHLDLVLRQRRQQVDGPEAEDQQGLYCVPCSRLVLRCPLRIAVVWFIVLAALMSTLFPMQRSVVTNGSSFLILALGVTTVLHVLRQWRWWLAGLVTSVVLVAPQLGATVYHLGTGSGPLSGNALCTLLIFLAAWAGPHRARMIFLSAVQASAALDSVLDNTANLTAAAARSMPPHVAKRALKALRTATEQAALPSVAIAPAMAVTDNYPDFVSLHVHTRWKRSVESSDSGPSQANSTHSVASSFTVQSSRTTVASGSVIRRQKQRQVKNASSPTGIDNCEPPTDILRIVEEAIKTMSDGTLAFIQALGDNFTIGGPFIPQGDVGITNAANSVLALLDAMSDAAPNVEFVAAAALEEAAGAIVGVHSLRYRVYGVALMHSKALMDAAEAQTGTHSVRGAVLFATRRFRSAVSVSEDTSSPQTPNPLRRERGAWLPQTQSWCIRGMGVARIHAYSTVPLKARASWIAAASVDVEAPRMVMPVDQP